jgi:sulfite oxidase
MNGQPLAARHGYPVRVIVPGVLGARSVKWLDSITVSDRESPNFYQQRDYRILPPEIATMEAAGSYWSKCESMLEMPVNSSVCVPQSDSMIVLPSSGLVEVKGYAVPQGSSGPVVRVQVSGDSGETWVDADLDCGGENASKWSWVLWSASIRLAPGKDRSIFSKATDAAGNTQEHARSTWNVRGVAYNGHEAVINLTVIENSRL